VQRVSPPIKYSMNYTEFQEYVRQHCAYETIYEDTNGRAILVIRLLDAFTMIRKAGELLAKIKARNEEKS